MTMRFRFGTQRRSPGTLQSTHDGAPAKSPGMGAVCRLSTAAAFSLLVVLLVVVRATADPPGGCENLKPPYCGYLLCPAAACEEPDPWPCWYDHSGDQHEGIWALPGGEPCSNWPCFSLHHHSQRYHLGILGHGWSHSFEVFVQEPAAVPEYEQIDARLMDPLGYTIDFTLEGGAYVPYYDCTRWTLTWHDVPGYFTAVDESDDVYHEYILDTIGVEPNRWYVSEILDDAQQTVVSMGYVFHPVPEKKVLRTITHPSGCYLKILYDFDVSSGSAGRVARVESYNSQQTLVSTPLKFDYEGSGFLTDMWDADDYKIEYLYDGQSYNITRKWVYSTPDGHPSPEFWTLHWFYGPEARIISQQVFEQGRDLIQETDWVYGESSGRQWVTTTTDPVRGRGWVTVYWCDPSADPGETDCGATRVTVSPDPVAVLPESAGECFETALDVLTAAAAGCSPASFDFVSSDPLVATVSKPVDEWIVHGEAVGSTQLALRIASTEVATIAVEVLDPAGDADGDGMPNDWELRHGLDPLDPEDAGEDADGDGVGNLTEYLQGRDPTVGAVPDTAGLVNLVVYTPLEPES